MCELYKYINYRNGAYNIQRKGKHYGRYHEITTALAERDCLVKSEWDLDNCMEMELEYTYIKELLPPFGRNFSYIKEINGRYYIVKTTNGKTNYYKGFSNLNEAVKYRDLLVANNWKVEAEA